MNGDDTILKDIEPVMTQFLFVCAVCAVNTDRPADKENRVWLQLRRYATFVYYSVNYGKQALQWNYECYNQFACDASQADNGPLHYGIINTDWLKEHELGEMDAKMSIKKTSHQMAYNNYNDDNDNDISDGRPMVHKHADIAETLALRSVQLAEKQEELDIYQLQYRKLEKKMCELKLEMAEVKASKQ